MAQKFIAVRTSDLSGTELTGGDGDTIAFSIGRNHYVIDLTDDEVGAFYDALKPYTEAARKGDAPAPAKRGNAPGGAQDLGAIREWANANGHPVSARGRIPASVLEAYAAR